ncbi:IS5 family transposase [Alcaligenes sp.]|uniref:IS5 family transposase n=1 Tax=Alcaligenes sp. TaxID=512 RepID=UPI003D072FDA
MGPKPIIPGSGELFRQTLREQINLKHPLVKLADLIEWERIDAVCSSRFKSGRGRPATSPRLIAGLLYLQHAFDLSDDDVVWGWVENPYWQVFTGETYLQIEPPIDPSSLTRWRQRLGEEGIEELLAVTISAGQRSGAVRKSSLKTVIVDTTVMPKAVAHPTDSRLLERSREHLVKAAGECGLKLRQNYNREAPKLALQIGRYAHARQFKRMNKVLRTKQILTQRTKDKNKLYALHAPEVECISKGKARTPYEFGVKVSITTTLKEGFVVGARSMPGNPYDGHTLPEALEQASILSETPIHTAVVDRGYRGVEVPGTRILRSGQRRGITKGLKAMIKRRSAIEPTIGHMKSDGKLDRNWLMGRLGDAIHAILCGAGHNIRLLLRRLRLFYALMLVWLVGPINEKHGMAV